MQKSFISRCDKNNLQNYIFKIPRREGPCAICFNDSSSARASYEIADTDVPIGNRAFHQIEEASRDYSYTSRPEGGEMMIKK